MSVEMLPLDNGEIKALIHCDCRGCNALIAGCAPDGFDDLALTRAKAHAYDAKWLSVKDFDYCAKHAK